MNTRKKFVRHVSIGITPALEAALTSLPIKSPMNKGGEDEAWWLRLLLEEGAYAMAEHIEAGNRPCMPSFAVVPGQNRRGLQREADQRAVDELLGALPTEPLASGTSGDASPQA